MKNIKFFAIISFLAIFSGCIDIIQLKLHNTAPVMILEATVDVTDSTSVVYASYSTNFYDSTKIYADNLQVSLLNISQNKTYTLSHTEQGTYKTNGIIGNEGDIFRIEVIDENGKKYTAQAQTPEKTPTIKVVFIPNSNPRPGSQITFLGFITWIDSTEIPSFYNMQVFLHDKFAYKMIMNDQTAFSDTIQTGFRNLFEIGDTAKVQLNTINMATFTFFDELQQSQSAGFGSAAPFNPTSNFDNDALGYFCVRQHKIQTFIVSAFPFH